MSDNTGGFRNNFKQLVDQIGWADRNSGGSAMGAMMGFMGMPFNQKRGGQWMTVDPRNRSVMPMGTVMPTAPKPQTNPNPNTPPQSEDEKKRAAMIAAGLTPEYVDWYMSNGRFGGVSPVQGIL